MLMILLMVFIQLLKKPKKNKIPYNIFNIGNGKSKKLKII